MTTQVYLDHFQNMVDVIEHTGGTIGHQPGLEQLIMTKLNIIHEMAAQLDRLTVKKEAQGRFLAVAFILGADTRQFGRLIENLEDDYLQGPNAQLPNHTDRSLQSLE